MDKYYRGKKCTSESDAKRRLSPISASRRDTQGAATFGGLEARRRAATETTERHIGESDPRDHRVRARRIGLAHPIPIGPNRERLLACSPSLLGEGSEEACASLNERTGASPPKRSSGGHLLSRH